jgi:hypothetical protein
MSAKAILRSTIAGVGNAGELLIFPSKREAKQYVDAGLAVLVDDDSEGEDVDQPAEAGDPGNKPKSGVDARSAKADS